MRYNPYEYQQRATRWILDNPRCALFLDMGLGKSVITLTALQTLIDECEVTRTLVVAPKKVAETTWTTEALKWDHLQSLSVVKVMGTEKQRIKALETPADVYVLGRDSFVWLNGYYGGRLPFDTLVIDELTSFKNPKSNRFKSMRVANPGFRRVIGLTGTPAPNGLIDLWAQMYCIDMGERLGRSVTRYRDTYFDLHRWNNIVVKCKVKKGCAEVIQSKLADICLTMQARDYLQLPDLIVHEERVQLSPMVEKAYRDFERSRVLEFAKEHADADKAIMANSAAALMNKLSQYANGAVYDDEGKAYEVHGEKLDRLAELIEAAQSHVLVFYQYRHDVERITARLKKADKAMRVHEYKCAADLEAWNAGEVDVMLAHPASTAYGLNMQQGGHYIVWFGTGWNLELYQQANARLHRQGQQCPVQVYKLMCAGTVDERANSAIEGKKGVQQALLDSLDSLMRKYLK